MLSIPNTLPKRTSHGRGFVRVGVVYAGQTWHTIAMSKRKRPRDINQLAKFIVEMSTGEAVLNEAPDAQRP
jgi:hypothetical protein